MTSAISQVNSIRVYAPLPRRVLTAPQQKWRTRSQWLENSAKTNVSVPLEEAWELWSDRQRIPTWMQWITSVDVMEDDPRMSRWTLSTYQFNRQVSKRGDATFLLVFQSSRSVAHRH